ncbi:uncharacterized protein LOC129907831 [Episyrphus balteatus]|uniref:uncharacterized protein LOC129907831 n=1 Tax=Episyrphus balteatus TaxID=286459 RepID=UPI002485AAF7|nr:uncharacterized protein LOC129907831 [Episyrphus balteatus]
MNLNYQFIVFIVILCQFFSASISHISQSQLEASCDVHLLLERYYGYTDFFEVNMKNNLKKDNERLHLELYVMASKDVNILFSSNNNYDGPHYEIVLGNEHNCLSRIRVRRNRIEVVVENWIPNMLSPFRPTLVEIIQRNDGKLIVNVPGYAEPLMTYLDENPIQINYFGFSTWDKLQAKYFYNCQFDENSKMESQKNNEEQLAISKILPTDSNTKQAMDFCWSGFLNRHTSFFHDLVPTLDKFDDNQVIEFQQEVIEAVKKIKKRPTTEKSIKLIDVRSGW